MSRTLTFSTASSPSLSAAMGSSPNSSIVAAREVPEKEFLMN